MSCRFLTFALLAFQLCTPSVRGATVHVPGDQPTIQAGIDAAAAGDTVELAAGIYYECGLVINKQLTLRGPSGFPPSAVIDGQGLGRILTFTSPNGLPAIRGIDFRNGRANLPVPGNQGGAIWTEAANLTISECVFRNNRADLVNNAVGTGGAINCRLVSAISTCLFENNVANSGGAIFSSNPSFQVADCTFQSNATLENGGGGAIMIQSSGSPTFVRCSFIENEATGGGALHIGGGNINPFFQDCLFLRNSGTDAGGAIMCSVGAQPQFTKCLFARNGSLLGGVIGSENASPSFESCTFANNDAVLGSVFYVYSTPIHVSYSIVAFNGTGDVSMCLGSSVQASCTDMYGNVAGDWTGCLQNQLQDPSNFSADPLFCDPDEDNYSLLVGSPCAPPGLTGCGLVGAFPQACGPISVKADSWGAIKARFR